MKTLVFLIEEMQDVQKMIRYVALLAKELKLGVHVLHVQNPPSYGAYGHVERVIPPEPEMFEKITNESKKEIVEFIKEIGAELAGIPSIEFKSEIGDASLILKEKVENKKYDMVVLKSNSKQGFLLKNSAIMDIVYNVPCPVYIIPSEARFQTLKKIVYATDYHEEDITMLKSLIKLTKPFEPEIIALHISNDNEFEKKLKSEGFAAIISEKTGYNKISVKMIAEEDGKDAVESLVNEAEKANVNLIVVLKQNRNFFERLFKSSFTAELVENSQLPILVFHKEN
jgi:nucleotide-binding universal stress UspA family protein